jgi:hypothetical protein
MRFVRIVREVGLDAMILHHLGYLFDLLPTTILVLNFCNNNIIILDFQVLYH